MPRRIKHIFICCLLLLQICAIYSTSNATDSPIIVGTGSVSGAYYPVGGALCSSLKWSGRDVNTKLRCFVESTGGSIYNLTALRSGEVTIGLTQNDWLEHSYIGDSVFKESGKDSSLRVLFMLHTETLTLIAKKGSGIKTLADIKGKRLSLGEDDSGMRLTVDKVLETVNMPEKSFAIVMKSSPSEQMAAFCDGKVDAMFIVLGNPNSLTGYVTKNCDGVIIPVLDDTTQSLVRDYAFYIKTQIKNGIYESNRQNIATIGIRSAVVTTTKMDEQTAYNVAKATYNNLGILRSSHYIFSDFTKDDLVTDSVVPIHNGALKFYKEVGLVK